MFMKYVWFPILFLISTQLLAQTAGPEAEKPAAQPSSEEEKHEAKDGYDKDFYESYYKNLPDNVPITKAKLEYNLVKTLKREIISWDASKPALEMAAKIEANNIKYEKVTRDSKWVRGIFSNMPYLKNKDYMYVVRHDKYLCFMTFEANPEKYIQQARQAQITFPPKDTFEVVIPKP